MPDLNLNQPGQPIPLRYPEETLKNYLESLKPLTKEHRKDNELIKRAIILLKQRGASEKQIQDSLQVTTQRIKEVSRELETTGGFFEKFQSGLGRAMCMGWTAMALIGARLTGTMEITMIRALVGGQREMQQLQFLPGFGRPGVRTG